MLPDLPPEPLSLPPDAPLKMSRELPRNNLLAGRSSAPSVQCFSHAAERNAIDPLVLLAVMKTENGRPGEVALNTDGSVDLGPMSINTVWVPQLAQRYGWAEQETRQRLASDGCLNVAAAAWILKQKIVQTGSVWEGVAHFHSSNPARQGPYLKLVQERFTAIVRRFANGIR
jgi:hypothetical protein